MEYLRTFGATCINERNKIEFMGGEDWYASTMRRPYLVVTKCKLGNCKSDEEIKEFLKDTEIHVVMLSKSYDTSNYNPQEKL